MGLPVGGASRVTDNAAGLGTGVGDPGYLEPPPMLNDFNFQLSDFPSTVDTDAIVPCTVSCSGLESVQVDSVYSLASADVAASSSVSSAAAGVATAAAPVASCSAAAVVRHLTVRERLAAFGLSPSSLDGTDDFGDFVDSYNM